MRTRNLNKVVKAVEQYAENIQGFEPIEWLCDHSNVALIDENENIALFERQVLNPVSVHGHYFFFDRGKEAVKAAKNFLKEIFTGPYDVSIIIGLTPIEHKGALWMNKRLGFTELGIVETTNGDHMSVMMTKQQWQKDHNNE